MAKLLEIVTRCLKMIPKIFFGILILGILLPSAKGFLTKHVVSNLTMETARVVRVVDGDTLVAEIKGKHEKIRLIGIDTPESVHPDAKKNNIYGEKASAYVKSILKEGDTIYLEEDEKDQDQYGRLLRYVWLETPNNAKSYEQIKEKQLNGKLLYEGYAVAKSYAPNTKYRRKFEIIAEEAMNCKNGLWQYPEYQELVTSK